MSLRHVCVLLFLGLGAPLAAQSPDVARIPATYPQCNGPAWYEYQVETQVRLHPDATLLLAPTDTTGLDGLIAEFVVDSAGLVIPASFRARQNVTATDLEQVVKDLPYWRYTPARLGGRAVCQIVDTYLRRGRRPAESTPTRTPSAPPSNVSLQQTRDLQ